jgi:hypothetical protein
VNQSKLVQLMTTTYNLKKREPPQTLVNSFPFPNEKMFPFPNEKMRNEKTACCYLNPLRFISALLSTTLIKTNSLPLGPATAQDRDPTYLCIIDAPCTPPSLTSNREQDCVRYTFRFQCKASDA